MTSNSREEEAQKVRTAMSSLQRTRFFFSRSDIESITDENDRYSNIIEKINRSNRRSQT